ncbi:hypothetical protein [Metakosakonia massiliensis]|uniref:Uncharacterized protein n=1 Tax=Phytobacter massiliensis TaxID=1485952 RepID=A0A6N3HT40_9ENTR
MKIILRFTVLITTLIAMLCLFLLTADKYDVIYDSDPFIKSGSFINDSDGKMASGVVVCLAVLLQSAFCFYEKAKIWKLFSFVLILSTLLFYAVR